MRLFIAINFTNGMQARLAALRNRMRASAAGGNFTRTENLHLTLAFLGQCREKQLIAAKMAMDQVRFAPFELRVDRVGRFRHDSGDVFWAGVAPNATLQALHRELSDKLKNAGFCLDARAYRPHITLGRGVSAGEADFPITPFEQTVRHIVLMESTRVDGRLVYSMVYRRDFLAKTDSKEEGTWF